MFDSQPPPHGPDGRTGLASAAPASAPSWATLLRVLWAVVRTVAVAGIHLIVAGAAVIETQPTGGMLPTGGSDLESVITMEAHTRTAFASSRHASRSPPHLQGRRVRESSVVRMS
jgi:hypothetical protein